MTEDSRVLLLVENEAVIALDEVRRLKKYGYRVLLAHSGEDAIELVGTSNEHIDLILMDIDLGSGRNGLDVAVEILKDRELPIIFLSSHIDDDIIERIKRITPYGHIKKDTEMALLQWLALNQYNVRLKQ